MMSKNYIIIRFSSLGDTILTTGLIEYLGRIENKKTIIVTKKNFAPIFFHNPFIEKIYTLETSSIFELFNLFKTIKRKYKNIPILDLHVNLRSSFLSLLWQGKVYRYSKLSLQRRIFLLSKGKIKFKALNYSVPERYALTYFALNNIPKKNFLIPKIYLTQKEKIKAQKILKKLHLKSNNFVAIHPYASFKTKTWPQNYWLEYIDYIEKKHIPYIILGREKQILPVYNSYNLTNKTTLRETLALLNEAKIVLSTDSGPMHMAWALNKPLICLFGPSVPEWGFFPYGENVHIFQERNIKCRPCSLHGTSTCSYNLQCLKKISPFLISEATYTLYHKKDKDEDKI